MSEFHSAIHLLTYKEHTPYLLLHNYFLIQSLQCNEVNTHLTYT